MLVVAADKIVGTVIAHAPAAYACSLLPSFTVTTEHLGAGTPTGPMVSCPRPLFVDGERGSGDTKFRRVRLRDNPHCWSPRGLVAGFGECSGADVGLTARRCKSGRHRATGSRWRHTRQVRVGPPGRPRGTCNCAVIATTDVTRLQLSCAEEAILTPSRNPTSIFVGAELAVFGTAVAAM